MFLLRLCLILILLFQHFIAAASSLASTTAAKGNANPSSKGISKTSLKSTAKSTSTSSLNSNVNPESYDSARTRKLTTQDYEGFALLSEATKQLDDKNYKLAEITYRKAIELIPWYEKAWFNYAYTLNKLSNFVEEKRILLKLTKEHPRYALAWYNLGLSYFNEGNYKDASLTLNNYIKLVPNSKESDSAKKVLKEIANLEKTTGTSVAAMEGGGKAYNQAMGYLKEADKILSSEEDTAKAIELVKKACTLLPKYPVARRMLISAYLEEGEFRQAAQEAESLVKIKADDPNNWRLLGTCQMELGDFDEAIKAYRQYVALANKSHNPEELAHIESSKETISTLEQELAEQDQMLNQTDLTKYLSDIRSNGYNRWQPDRFPLRVYIESGKNTEGFQPEFETVLRKSFQQWTEATKGKVSFVFINDANRADIRCKWTSTVDAFQQKGESGEAQSTISNYGIERVKIILLTRSIKSTGGSVTSIPRKVKKVHRVCLHEIGHALGLSGHSRNSKDIMFFSESASSKAQAELSNRDKATMMALYDLDEEVVQQSKNPKQTQVASTEPSEEISESGLSLSELAEDGKKAFLAQDYEESSKKFAECLKLSSDNLKIRIALGHSLNALADAKIQEKKANEAEQILRKCISLIEKTDQTDLLTTSLRKLRALMQENQQYDQVNQITLRLGQIESKSSQSQASN